jgi:hypothetical protein
MGRTSARWIDRSFASLRPTLDAIGDYSIEPVKWLSFFWESRLTHLITRTQKVRVTHFDAVFAQYRQVPAR